MDDLPHLPPEVESLIVKRVWEIVPELAEKLVAKEVERVREELAKRYGVYGRPDSPN